MKPFLAAAVGLVALALCSGAWAADRGKPAENAFNLQPIALPVLSKGVLVNYVFITLKLVLGPGQDATRLHEREPFLRDSLVRMAVHTPFNGPGNLGPPGRSAPEGHGDGPVPQPLRPGRGDRGADRQ